MSGKLKTNIEKTNSNEVTLVADCPVSGEMVERVFCQRSDGSIYEVNEYGEHKTVCEQLAARGHAITAEGDLTAVIRREWTEHCIESGAYVEPANNMIDVDAAVNGRAHDLNSGLTRTRKIELEGKTARASFIIIGASDNYCDRMAAAIDQIREKMGADNWERLIEAAAIVNRAEIRDYVLGQYYQSDDMAAADLKFGEIIGTVKWANGIEEQTELVPASATCLRSPNLSA